MAFVAIAVMCSVIIFCAWALCRDDDAEDWYEDDDE